MRDVHAGHYRIATTEREDLDAGEMIEIVE
jgi:hypothetical protein